MPRKSRLAGKKTYQPKKKGQMKRRPRKTGQIKGQGGQTIKYNSGLTQYHRVRKTLLSATYFTAGIPGINAIFNPTIGAMPDFGNYSTIFSHFMINSVSVTFRWVDNDTGSALSLQDVKQPVLNVCYNDDGNLTNAVLIQEKRNVVQHTFTPERSVFTYTFYPKTISPVYYSSVASGYRTNPKTFIDCDYSGTPHYGMLMYCDVIPGGTQINVDYHWDVTFKHQQ